MIQQKKIDIEEVRAAELDLLIKFAAYCDEKNLCYCLCGGTLLGAIRHQGFIPWDDDIDVMMPRKDYLKFIGLQHQKRQFDYCTAVDGTGNIPIMKILDKEIHVKVPYSEGEQVSYAWIDVFPIDGIYEDEDKFSKQLRKIWFLRKLSNAARGKIGKGTTWYRVFAKTIALVPAKLVGARNIAQQIDKIAMEVPFEDAVFVGGLTWGYAEKEKMPKEEWTQRVRVSFEGNEFWTLGCWDYYLKSLFGNYMELPPEEKRQPHLIYAWREEKL